MPAYLSPEWVQAFNDALSGLDLSDAETRHTERVCALIRDEIAAAGGWISFERYMDLALYAPGLGYYSAGARKLGSGGDFTTAPEISGLFGACLAQQCAEVLSAVAGGSILEVGAGSGRLAVDIMTRLEALERLPDRYYILEVSADLSARQRALVHAHIPHLEPRMQWLEAPPLKPFDGVILANEVLDALPVVRFRWCAGACEEPGRRRAGTGMHAAGRRRRRLGRWLRLGVLPAAGCLGGCRGAELTPRRRAVVRLRLAAPAVLPARAA